MGAPAGYLGYMFAENGLHKYGSGDGQGWEMKGHVFWTLAPQRVRTTQEWQQVLKEWNAAGYKIGMLLHAEQQVDELVYGGNHLQRVPDAEQDLDSTFGTPTGFRWSAFGGRGEREHEIIPPIVIRFPLTVRIRPAGPRADMIIRVVSRHLEGRFSDGCMRGLWAVPNSKP